MTKSIKLIAVLCSLFASTVLVAQTSGLNKLSLSAGIGVAPTFLADDATVNTPPLSARLTYQISKSFNLSGFVGYSNTTSTAPFLISDGQQSLVNNKMFMYGLRGEMKKSISDKFEIYGGALIGASKSDKREFDTFTGETINRDEGPTPFNPNSPKSELLYAGFVGTTYYLHKNIGLFAEVGYGISLLSTGITIRI